MLRKQHRPTLEIHPEDAAARGIKHGEWVRAFNERGEAYFVADVQDSVAPGVTCHVSIWWRQYSPRGWNCNALTSDAAADMGGGATFHTNLVQVEAAGKKLNAAEIEEMNRLFLKD
jgi:anaerobic selenocysteine-containing dehydrogenase